MAAFTAWVQAADGEGTIWISAVEAETVEQAKQVALDACCADWGEFGPDDLHVLGIARGDVCIEFWEDIV